MEKPRKIIAHGITPLMRAAVNPDAVIELTKLLIDPLTRKTLFFTDKKGRTALDFARIARNHHATTLLMHAVVAEINNARIQSITCSDELEKLLIATNNSQGIQLREAIRTRNSTLASQILHENKLNRKEIEGLKQIFFTDWCSKVGYNALMLASGMSMKEVVQQLLNLQVPIDHTNQFGHTALITACLSGDADIVYYLLINGADIHHRTNEGRTVLHYACLYAKSKVIKMVFQFLLERFAIFRMEKHSLVDFDSTRWTTYASILETFINSRDNDGKTAIDLLPHSVDDKYRIEKRLQITQIQALASLNQRCFDTSSTHTNTSHVVDLEEEELKYRQLAQLDLLQQEKQYLTKNILPHESKSAKRKSATLTKPKSSKLKYSDAIVTLQTQDVLPESPLQKTTTRIMEMYEESEDMIHTQSKLSEHFQTPFGNAARSRGNTVDPDATGKPLALGDLTGASYKHQVMTNEANEDDIVSLGSQDRSHDDENGSEQSLSELSYNSHFSLMDFSHVTDDQQVLEFHPIVAIDHTETYFELEPELKNIQQSFDVIHRRIYEWKMHAEKEKEFVKEYSCPMDCGKIMRMEDVLYHVRELCPNRPVQCSQCKEVITFHTTNHHLLHDCSHRYITCRDCFQSILCKDLGYHLRIECTERPTPCTNPGCSVTLPHKDLEVHLLSHCCKRIITCDQCFDEMPAEDFANHLLNFCPERMIKCSIGCNLLFPAKSVEYHEQEECLGYCRYNCSSKKIGPPIHLQYHEQVECPEKPDVCCYSCDSVPYLTRGHKKSHEEYHCPLRPILCNLGCNEYMLAKDKNTHQDKWLGNCSLRKVNCPSNLVGWKILLFVEEKSILPTSPEKQKQLLTNKDKEPVAFSTSKIKTKSNVFSEVVGDDHSISLESKVGSVGHESSTLMNDIDDLDSANSNVILCYECVPKKLPVSLTTSISGLVSEKKKYGTESSGTEITDRAQDIIAKRKQRRALKGLQAPPPTETILKHATTNHTEFEVPGAIGKSDGNNSTIGTNSLLDDQSILTSAHQNSEAEPTRKRRFNFSRKPMKQKNKDAAFIPPLPPEPMLPSKPSIIITRKQIEGVITKYYRIPNPKEMNCIGVFDDRESFDFIYVKANNGFQWYPLWKTKFIMLEKTYHETPGQMSTSKQFDDPTLTSATMEVMKHDSIISRDLHPSAYFPCGLIIRGQLGDHLYEECPYRSVFVMAHDEQVTILSKALEYEHHTNDSFVHVGRIDYDTGSVGMKSISSSIMQGDISIASVSGNSYIGQQVTIQEQAQLYQKKLDEHESFQDKFLISPSTTSCPSCGKIFDKTKLKSHLEYDCPLVELFCPLACGNKILRRQINEHCTNVCPKRNVICSQCQGNDLWAEELDQHMKTTCSHRIVPCPLRCTKGDLPAHLTDHHVAEECPLRIIQCHCGHTMQAEKLFLHQRDECEERTVACPQGCHELMPFYKVNDHMEINCPNRFYIYDKVTECPNGCGLTMMKKELIHHVTYVCEKRLVECSYMCGNVIQLDILKNHLIICPKRVLCCEPGVTMCSRMFHQWFFKPSSKQPEVSDDETEGEEENETKLGNASTSVDSRTVESRTIATVNSESTNTTKSHTKLLNGKNSGDLQMMDQQLLLFEGKNLNLQIGVSENPNDDIKNGFFNRLTIKKTNKKLENDKDEKLKLKKKKKKSKKKPSDNDGENENKSIQSALSATSAATHDSSPYYVEDNAMKLRENLKMEFCARHHTSIIMAAIRYDELTLMEFITRHVKESEDIDRENIYGDTPMTLACRLGKLDCVKLLLQHGADINKETFNGRTALIEAVKADEEYVQLIEYLINQGALVAYKTAKHGRTALDWARRYAITEEMIMMQRLQEENPKQVMPEISVERKRLLGRPKTVRILELAAMVQAQTNLMFNKISQGDTEWVSKALEDGDFFNPYNEMKNYRYMEENAEKAEEIDLELDNQQQKLWGLSKFVEDALERQQDMKKQVIELSRQRDEAYKQEKEWDSKIHTFFKEYETASYRIQVEDLEEISRLQKPNPLLLIGLYISAMIFDFFPPKFPPNFGKAPITKEDILNTTNEWMPAMRQQLNNSKIFVRRLQTYSRAKMHIERCKALFQAIRELFPIFLEAIQNFKFSLGNTFGANSLLTTGNIYDMTQNSSIGSIVSEDEQSLGGSSLEELSVIPSSPMGKSSKRMVSPSRFDSPPRTPLNKSRKESTARTPTGEKKSPSKRTIANSSFSMKFPVGEEKTSNDLSFKVDNIEVEDLLTTTQKPMELSETLKSSLPSEFFAATFRPPTNSTANPNVPYENPWEELDVTNPESLILRGTWIKGEWVPYPNAVGGNSWELPRTNSDDAEIKPKLSKSKLLKTSEAIGEEEDEESNVPPPIDEETKEKLDQEEEEMKRARNDFSLTADEKALAKRKQRLIHLTDDLIQAEKFKTIQYLEAKYSERFANELDLTVGNSDTASISSSKFPGSRGGTASTDLQMLSSLTNSNMLSPLGSIDSNALVVGEGNMSVNSTPFRSKSAKNQKPTSAKNKGDDGMIGENAFSPSKKEKRSKSKSSSRSKRRDRGKKVDEPANLTEVWLRINPFDEISDDDLLGFPFLQLMLLLMKAIIAFEYYYTYVLNQKPQLFYYINTIEKIQEEHKDLTRAYHETFDNRANIEKTYLQFLKKSKFFHDKVKVFREKTRIARLMNIVAVNGHTMISWAASYGNFDMIEVMLSRGATVGFNAELLHLTATYLQYTYKIYRTSQEMRGRKYESDPLISTMNLTVESGTGLLKKAENMRYIKELTRLKDYRAKLLTTIQYQRSRMRFPIPEAAYAGKWEIIQRIYERRLLHVNFCNTWIFPSPPPPYRRNLSHQYDHNKMTLAEVISHGMNDLAAGCYIAAKGWVPPNDEEEPYGELCTHILVKMLSELKEKREKFVDNRKRIRILSKERKNQIEGEKEMIKAIYEQNFRKVVYLAEHRGITIDLETPDGQTALISACEENVDALNHEYMINDDGRKCLAVEYLLDRKYYRPSINLETTVGYTALIRAAAQGRGHVLCALLDRGANINYVNKFGNTALHYSAKLGHTEITRILVERFADLDLKDTDGFTPYEIAERENYVNLMKLLSQFRGGNVGALQLTRGKVNNLMTCSIGCGAVLSPYDLEKHLLVCPLRTVPCPNHCDIANLFAREVDDHIANDCIYRTTICTDCGITIIAKDLPRHLEDDCPYRIVNCPNYCGKTFRANELDNHLKSHCPYRLVECPLLCRVCELVTSTGQPPLPIANGDADKKLLLTDKANTTTSSKLNPFAMIASLAEMEKTTSNDNTALTAVTSTMMTVIPANIDTNDELETTLIRFTDVDKHTKNDCPNRRVPCPLLCHNEVIFHLLPAHLNDFCICRLITCSFCEKKFPKTSVDHHMQYTCEARLVPCSEKCGEMVPMNKQRQHLLDSCITQVISCPNAEKGCSLRIQRRYLQQHLEKECEQRIISCPNKCEDIRHPLYHPATNPLLTMLNAKEMPFHLKYDCQCRLQSCSLCQQRFPIKDLATHQANDCLERKVNCTNEGCAKQLIFKDLEYHAIHQCRFRKILCAQGCGEWVVALHHNMHLTRTCEMRMVPCSAGCGTQLRLKDMTIHLEQECIRRFANKEEANNSTSWKEESSKRYQKFLQKHQEEKLLTQKVAASTKEKGFSSDLLQGFQSVGESSKIFVGKLKQKPLTSTSTSALPTMTDGKPSAATSGSAATPSSSSKLN